IEQPPRPRENVERVQRGHPGEVGKLRNAVSGDEEGAGGLRLRLAQRRAELRRADLDVAVAERDPRAGVDEVVLPPGGGQPPGDAQRRPPAPEPQIEGAGAPDAVGQALVEGARDAGSRLRRGRWTDPAQDFACVSDLLKMRQARGSASQISCRCLNLDRWSWTAE